MHIVEAVFAFTELRNLNEMIMLSPVYCTGTIRA